MKKLLFLLVCLLSITSAYPQTNKSLLYLGKTALEIAKRKTQIKNPNILTIIDFSLPSDKPRLTVYNLKDNTILLITYVSHGVNSGSLYATSFSNQLGSLKSSIGSFVTLQTYIGHNGLSLKIKGLDSYNSNVLERKIVFHPAKYADPTFLKTHSYLGRSFGCFAIPPSVSYKLISLIKDGTFVYVYGR